MIARAIKTIIMGLFTTGIGIGIFRYETQIFINVLNSPITVIEFIFFIIWNFWPFMVSLIFSLGGWILTIIWIKLLTKAIIVNNKKKRLKDGWLQTVANITGIKESWIIVNNEKYYFIIAEYNGETLISKEDTPYPILNGTISVYFDPSAPSEYRMDLESMVKKAPKNN